MKTLKQIFTAASVLLVKGTSEVITPVTRAFMTSGTKSSFKYTVFEPDVSDTIFLVESPDTHTNDFFEMLVPYSDMRDNHESGVRFSSPPRR